MCLHVPPRRTELEAGRIGKECWSGDKKEGKKGEVEMFRARFKKDQPPRSYPPPSPEEAPPTPKNIPYSWTVWKHEGLEGR